MLTAARLGAAALTGALFAGVAAAPALADTAAPSASAAASSPAASSPAAASAAAPAGLYGKGDPQYDGVWRQSLALIALQQEKVVPADSAVQWLLGQQCEDGGWPSYRAEGAPCTPATEDTNATAMAVQALTALGGHQPQAGRGVEWLRAQQNPDGTWAYNPGAAGDADSTALVVNALLAAGADPAQVGAAPHTAYDGLASFQLGCAAAADQRGAFVYQPVPNAPAAANTLASAQALLAAAGGHLPVATTDRRAAPPKAPACADANGTVAHADSAEADAAYLTGKLAAGGQRLLLDTPGAAAGPDFNSTAWAVLGLVAAGHGAEAASAADWLAGNGYAWAAQGKSGTDPAATATLVLTARAAQLDPYNFGGANLVQLLADAGPKPKSAPAAGDPEATRAPGSAITEPDENSGFSAGWLIGVGLLVGIGAGILLSLNRRRHTAAAAPAVPSATDAETPAGGSAAPSEDR
ncbi:prenyltransferase/squalene oxidase repeat-containing protein [Streptomyces sp. TLI_171]|uniref:prenyltransferase/squalene oxidase repeat-containing protein n=1 Tax=Streptomyces sp. TLI_171 TaxID=1938859 RepID=UPI000C17BB0D|nr:prenyltransferase/squalene oxidase repeat-containing protein [Streptomyces sp. TLI_171]RKE18884.1 squalene-hopene cyclase-like protein [Streptomyces sp. TLI_171]